MGLHMAGVLAMREIGDRWMHCQSAESEGKGAAFCWVGRRLIRVLCGQRDTPPLSGVL